MKIKVNSEIPKILIKTLKFTKSKYKKNDLIIKTIIMTKKSINVLGTDVVLFEQNEFDFISLTDIAKYKGDKSDVLIQSWMRNRNTVEFLGLWETLNNPNFKPHEFEGFRKEAGLNSFLMSPKKWAENTNAIGIISKSGKYGGTLMQIL